MVGRLASGLPEVVVGGVFEDCIIVFSCIGSGLEGRRKGQKKFFFCVLRYRW